MHGPVERVKKIKDYAFVHFGTKQDTHMAMQAMNGTVYNFSLVYSLRKQVEPLGGRYNLIYGWDLVSQLDCTVPSSSRVLLSDFQVFWRSCMLEVI